MTDTNLFLTEQQFYKVHKQEYLKIYKNQFVLIKGEEFIGAFTTEAEAYKAGVEQYGDQSFFIKQVVDNDGTVSFPALTVGAINITL
jgi:protein involved in polysaccharide export with SLBB domain